MKSFKTYSLKSMPKVFDKPLACLDLNPKTLEEKFSLKFELGCDDLGEFEGCCIEIGEYKFFLIKYLTYNHPITIYSSLLSLISLKVFLDNLSLNKNEISWVSPLAGKKESI